MTTIRLFLLLHDQFGEMWIPPGVLDELRVEEDLHGSQAMWEAIEAGWLRTKDVEDQALVSVLQRDLDQGEAEPIALAVQVNEYQGTNIHRRMICQL